MGMERATPLASTPGNTRRSASAAAAALGCPPCRQSSNVYNDWRTWSIVSRGGVCAEVGGQGGGLGWLHAHEAGLGRRLAVRAWPGPQCAPHAACLTGLL